MPSTKPSAENPATIHLIDASIYIFQAHFSPYVECHDLRGGQLSALFGFIQFLIQFLRRARPTHVAVAMDESLFQGFRHGLCPDYKSNRELPDDNLAMQLRGCAEVCRIFGLSAFGSKVYEADDIIGTLAQRMRTETDNKTALSIVSRDKDLAQLLTNPADHIWDFSGNYRRYWDDVVSDFGVQPPQIPDFLGLTGDAVDCIAGVPGVGPVKAKCLLEQFADLDGIYANIERVSDLPLRGARRLQALLQEHRPLAELGKRLATIVCDVVDSEETFSDIGMASLQSRDIDMVELEAFLTDYAFAPSDRNRVLSATRHLLEARGKAVAEDKL